MRCSMALGFEPFVVVTLVAGWQPLHIQRLKPGVGVLDANDDSSVRAKMIWDTNSWAQGLSIDAAIIKTITSAFSK